MSKVFLNILNMSISAGWLVLAVLVLRLVLKKAPRWVSVLLWGFVAVRLVCPISFESMLSLIPSAETVSPQIMMDRTPQISSGIQALNNAVNPVLSQSFTPAVGDSVNPLQIWIPIAAAVWAIGVAGMLIYTAVSYFLLSRKIGTAVRLRDHIFQSEYVDSPFVLGIIRPRIYLPYGLDGENLTYVIAHENAHIRRKDHWWKPLGFLLLAVHWFNPLMWVGYIILCRDIELACDEKVIKSMNNENRADYTQALVACSIHRRSIAACPLAFGEVGVKARVKSVMNYKKPGFWIMVAAIITCIVVAVCFLTNPMDQISLSKLNDDQANMPGILNDISEMTVTYGGISVSCDEEAEINRFIATLEKINVTIEPISKNRSEDRSKAFTIKVNGNTDLYFNENFTEFWVYDYVKPSLTHRITNPETAKELILDFWFTVKQPTGGVYEFCAKVIEVHDRYLLVEPKEGSAERTSADRIEVSLANHSSECMPKVGEEVKIVYDGLIQETYPARITNVYRVEIMNYDSGPVETIRGNMKTYYKNADGTWQVGGRIYKYRHEISGQVKNSINPSTATFVFLSNWEHIGFNQAWDALYSNNCADWFLVEDAVLVDYRTDNLPTTVNPQNQLDALISSVILNYGKSDKPDGLINMESHMILGHELVSATPALGETVHLREEAVFVYFLNARFRVVDGKPEEYSSHFSQAIITFTVDDQGGYVLKDFLEPQYAADYNTDLMNLFASASENAAENAEEYEQQLRQQCQNSAAAYLEDLSAQSGGTTQYHLAIDSILYDIDGDRAVDGCTLTPGPTSGLYSFCLNVNAASGSQYSCTCVAMGPYDLSFELGDDRSLRIKGEGSDEVVYFDIALEDGKLMLTCENEGIILRNG